VPAPPAQESDDDAAKGGHEGKGNGGGKGKGKGKGKDD